MKIDLSEEIIAAKIYFIRGEKVMLDKDLAFLYKIEVKRLKAAVRRNLKRFPDDFMFELNADEINSLRTQNSSLKKRRGEHSKYIPFAFTELGVAILSGVLNSQRAIDVNISIVRTFIKLRRLIYSNLELKEMIKELEKITNDRF